MATEGRRFSTAPFLIPVNDLRIFDEGDDTHLASEGRANKRVYLMNFVDHLGQASGRDMILKICFLFISLTVFVYKIRIRM